MAMGRLLLPELSRGAACCAEGTYSLTNPPRHPGRGLSDRAHSTEGLPEARGGWGLVRSWSAGSCCSLRSLRRRGRPVSDRRCRGSDWLLYFDPLHWMYHFFLFAFRM